MHSTETPCWRTVTFFKSEIEELISELIVTL